MRKILFILVVFVLGFSVGNLLHDDNRAPIILGVENAAKGAESFVGALVGENSPERASPGDRVAESQIHVYQDRVILDVQDAQWSTFTDTNSMDPVLDAGANAIQVVPVSSDEISVGDIISYEYDGGIIIHRVVELGNDEAGWYAIAKGDNNLYKDPSRVRFHQIKRVVIAIVF